MTRGLGREDIRALLDDLSQELSARGARAEQAYPGRPIPPKVAFLLTRIVDSMRP